MGKRDVPWLEVKLKYFREHPEVVPLYLEVALEEANDDGNWAAFMLAVRDVVELKGGVGELAKKVGWSRSKLQRALAADRSPRLNTIMPILRELGFRLSVTQQQPPQA